MSGKARNRQQCGWKKSEPRKEGGVRREDPRDDDERKFGPLRGEDGSDEGII